MGERDAGGGGGERDRQIDREGGRPRETETEKDQSYDICSSVHLYTRSPVLLFIVSSPHIRVHLVLLLLLFVRSGTCG